MSALDLSRLQFALTAIFHFLFLALTLGLAPIVAVMQTRWAVTGRAVHERLTRFWGQIYVVNYAMGIVIGLVLEFQFGLHWSGLMEFAGGVVGAPLATETLVAFFLESTFLGMWIFGWNQVHRWVHTALIWLVVVTAYLSAYWVMVANGFLQEPVGYVLENGVARIEDFGALLTNQQAIGALLHLIPACLLLASVVMVGVCSWHFLHGTPEVDFFRRSLRIGVVVGAVASSLVVGFGFGQFEYLTEGKELAFGASAEERAAFQAEMEARHGPGDWTPPTWVSAAWPVMENIGHLYSAIFLGLLFFLIKNAFDRTRPAFLRRFWHRFYVWTIPLPFIAVTCGWLLREVGRQPWAVYGELTVADAVSPRGAGAVLASLLVLGTVIAVLAALDWWLIARLARRGPEHAVLGSPFGGSVERTPEAAATALETSPAAAAARDDDVAAVPGRRAGACTGAER
ncbi:cytochrome ubiquinol oxidase subunit I [Phytoactinopolyspora halotolerans]|uniref:Cytochrome ubiquinol oxidase subunit I n=1 Tax=Phytoactinopolyspora halotolerans TaxID=1981512 RepID=A0A6L9SBZ9_9ACTN|nr:cytochrome ubiquinol oxidase subunit I [Phytoactinopolyspora halotolerans]NEE02539.1 cytochrome ubiquinol oxidase subunit I [Phytoactinopolyspora halotolerans]